MAPQTTKALEVARQFRKAIAMDLVTNSAQEAYNVLVSTVKSTNVRFKEREDYVPTRQELDAAKCLLGMAGVLEPRSESHEGDIGRLSLAELEKMIADLKVVDVSAAKDAATSAQVSDMLS